MEFQNRLENEIEGRRVFRELSKAGFSVVLFKNDTPIAILARHSLDVAVIAEARAITLGRFNKRKRMIPLGTTTTSTNVDRASVKRKVEEGKSLMIPYQRSLLHQWLLKRSMDAVFYRRTVQFFSAGPLRMSSRCFWSVRKYPAVKGFIALSLDDAPGRLGPRNSLIPEIRKSLDEYQAKATFMVISKYISGHEHNLERLIQDGHELGNHGILDQAQDRLSRKEFLAELDECTGQIEDLQRRAGKTSGVKIFRAPHGRYTRVMEECIESRGISNVMCDVYASDPVIEDGDYVARSLVRQARSGGIILLHMPEIGFREHCMVALRKLLEGLHRKGLQAVSVSMLERIAKQNDGLAGAAR